MNLKWIIAIIAIFSCIGAILGFVHQDFAIAADDSNGIIEKLLSDQLAKNGSADFIVRFTQQADLSSAYSMDWDARGEYVYHTLLETADSSQAKAKAILDSQGIPYQTFIAGNDLYVFGGSQTASKRLTSSQEIAILDQLAALPEVSSIRATRTYTIDPQVEQKPSENIIWAGDLLADHLLTTVASPAATVDWGITDSKADQFWTQFGVKGIGIIVANIDTGVQWDHPALKQAFRCGINPTDPRCWYDPSNECSGGSACDNNGHGTHTMGTMVADDNPYLSFIAGMAPDATWIACKGCESNSCSDVALNACANWILAPGGDPANRPNIVNNSWGGELGDDWFLANVNAWRAAGIFPAFSAGNSGSECETINSPGDYQESFSSAAHDANRDIADFSSRGPSTFGHDPYTKPNISAPGVSICSTVPTDSWSCGYSGTSMASPHIAGAVALLWSCNPSLVGQIDATFQLLQNNTDPAPAGNCGTPPDGQGNYTYGYGYLNLLKAGVATCNVQLGTVKGHVFNQESLPVEGATVRAMPTILNNQIQSTTDSTGSYTITLPVGTYDITASKIHFTSQTITGIEVQAGSVITQNFTLTQLGVWIQINLPAGCPDWTRFDGEYYPDDGLVYFLGGRSGPAGDQTFGDIISFNPASKLCADTGADMPEPISNYTISMVQSSEGNVLCSFGGRTSTGAQTQSVQCYNPHTNIASVVATMPPAWEGYGSYTQVVVNNMVYIFGGFRSAPPYMLARTEQFNPMTNSFTQKGDLNMARSYIMAAVVDGKIYAFGGDTYDGEKLVAQNIAEVFNPAIGTWNDSAVENMPTPSGEGRAYGFDSSSPYKLAMQVILVGGGQWPDDTNEVISYNVASNTYNTEFTDLNIARRDQAGFFVPGTLGKMWVFGGWSGHDTPPYAPPEFYSVEFYQAHHTYLPTILK